MKKRTLSTVWIRTISTGVFTALFAVVLLTLVMPTQAKAVCDVHSWGNWWTVQQPTCTENGMEQRSCHNCDTNEYRDIPATGHSWGTPRIEIEPTCTSAGKGRHSCSKCRTRGELYEIPALGHDWVTVENTPGTCIRPARTVKQCSRCGQQDITEGAYGTHSWGAWQTTEATCTANGERVRYCTTCADGVERESIPALGHNMVTVATHPATCMNRGYTELKCTRCGYTDTNEGTYGEHVMGEWQTTTQPTCTAAGEKRRTCTVCGKAPEQQTIPALGHNMVPGETVTGTCIREGYTSKKCSRCGHEEKTSTGYGAHVWGEWQTTIQPTCTAAGEKQRNCTVCGKAPEKETIPALGHDMVAGETVTGTCIREGYTSRKCRRCGYEEKTSTGYGAHVMGEWQTTTQPTCTTAGEKQRNCTVCGKVPEKETIPANGHRWGAWYVKTPAEIGKEGLEERDCQVCGRAETRPIPALEGEEARPELTLTIQSDPENGTPISKGQKISHEQQITNTGNVAIRVDRLYKNDKYVVGFVANNLLQPGQSISSETVGKINGQASYYAIGHTEDGQEVRSNTVTLEYPLIEDDPTALSKLMVEKVTPDGFATTIGADIPVQYKVTNTGDEPITIETSYHQEDTGDVQAVNLLNGKVLQPGESAETAVFTHHVNGFFQAGSKNQRPDETWLYVYVTGKTQSGEAVRSSWVRFSYSKAEDGETEPKLVLSKVSPDGYPVHMNMKETYWNFSSTVSVDGIWSVTNVSSEPIKITLVENSYPWRGNSASSGKAVDKTLLPGESYTSTDFGYNPYVTIMNPLTLMNNGGEYSTWVSWEATGVTESGEEVTSNTIMFNWPVILDEDPVDPTIDPEDPTHDPEDPNDPQNMAASLTVVKAETSAPANGQHYAAGEQISFSITYQNVGDKPISNIHIYDALAGLSEIGSTGSLAPGESRPCSFKYRVTAADVNVYGYVANTAFATYQDGGLTRKATSNRVVIILNPDIVPPGILDPENPDDPDDPDIIGLIPAITIGDPDNPFDPEHPEEYDGPFGLPGMQGEDHCELIVKNHATGTTDYDQHYCATHQSTRTAVQAMTNAASTPAVSLSAWTYARTLWQNDCNVLLEKLYGCANGPAKAIIMEEHIAFETMVAMRGAALNVLYPDQPEKVAEEIAKLYEDRCIELCYMLHTLPKAKPVEAASTEMFMMSGDGTICRTEITGDTGADVSYTETLCSQHGMTDMMTGFVLAGADDTTTAMKQIGLLWRSELRTEMDIIRGALPEENAAIITYDLGTTRIWLEAREALLQLLYPKQEAAVTNIINDTIKQRVTTLCEEANK